MEHEDFRNYLNDLISNKNHIEILSIAGMPFLKEDEIKRNQVHQAMQLIK